jgi:hypothetical protein
MNWLQIRLFGPYLSSFSTNSYGYYSQMSQNLFSNGQIFASALRVRQAASHKEADTGRNGIYLRILIVHEMRNLKRTWGDFVSKKNGLPALLPEDRSIWCR